MSFFCHKRGTKETILGPHEEQIPRSDALPLSHRDSGAQGHYEAHIRRASCILLG